MLIANDLLIFYDLSAHRDLLTHKEGAMNFIPISHFSLEGGVLFLRYSLHICKMARVVILSETVEKP